MPEDVRCASCGSPLAPGETRCGECGAPVRPAPAASRARLGAFLLVVLFGLAVFQTFFVLQDPLGSTVPTRVDFGNFALSGTVRDGQGSPVAGVTVSDDGTNTTTGPDGSYRLGNLTAGLHAVRFSSRENTSVELRVFLSRDQRADVTLPPAGESTRTNHPSVTPIRVASRICGGLMLGIGVLTLLGAVASWRKRKWGVALAGAIAGVFASLPLSLVVGGIAVYLVASSRREFSA